MTKADNEVLSANAQTNDEVGSGLSKLLHLAADALQIDTCERGAKRRGGGRCGSAKRRGTKKRGIRPIAMLDLRTCGDGGEFGGSKDGGARAELRIQEYPRKKRDGRHPMSGLYGERAGDSGCRSGWRVMG